MSKEYLVISVERDNKILVSTQAKIDGHPLELKTLDSSDGCHQYLSKFLHKAGVEITTP